MSDEYTANPYETEKEAQRVLRQMKIDNAKAEVKSMAEEARARRIDENTYKRLGQPVTRGGGGAGGEMGFGIQKMNKNLNRNFKAGGKVSSASSRGDGVAQRGKTKGRFV